MDDDTLCFTPATALASLIRERKLSPVELMRAVLGRVERVNPAVNAFALVLADTAMEQAKAAEQDVAAGRPLGPLHGIPVTIKDHEAIAGLPTEFGSFTRQGDIATYTAPVVTRLQQAGAIVIGKTTTPEFGWKGVSHGPLTGLTHNPWKPGYNAGASSAGAGAGAAAGFGPLHQGSDGAGSIRMPAHFCGVVGMKPTYGRVPIYPPSVADQIVHVGPLTRTVGDAALMLKSIAGPHVWDLTSLESPPADYPARLHDAPARPLRIAFSPDLGHARVDPDVADLVAKAVAAFGELGCAVEAVTPAWGKEGPEIARFLWAAHYSRYAELLPKWEAQMDPGFVACIRAGEGVSLVEYQRMRMRKYAYTNEIARFFQDWNFLVTPAVSVAAFPAERLMPAHWPQHDWDWLQWAEFSYPFNLSGHPAISVPCGFTAEGLPVGLQIVGPRFDDLGVLQLAARFEAARPWAQKRPALPF